MNKSDSERLAGYLEALGYVAEPDIRQSSLVFILTCGVRQSAEDRVYGLVPQIKKKNPGARIVISGCLSERADVRKRLAGQVELFLPIRALPELSHCLENIVSGRTIEVEAEKRPSQEAYLSFSPKYGSRFSAFVPIGNGCDNFCTYCVVPYARHREVYRPMEEIIREVEALVADGYKEITLIAQNVNSYRDSNKNFVDLIKKVNDIPGSFWLRFATSHPKDMSGELIGILPKLKKMCEYVHLPAQAGNNDVLRAMNRNYTVEHYLELLKKIRENYSQNPGCLPVCVTTDIIVGFPGETREQFAGTINLFKKAKYDMAYIARYSPRPGTAAAKLPDSVSPEEKKKREEALMAVLRQTAKANNQYYLGREFEVLVEGKNRKGEWYGKTRTFKAVKISDKRPEKTDLEGKIVLVRIDRAEDFGLGGSLSAAQAGEADLKKNQ